ncbi:MAG TPA: D-Ala-D-Ala carboxypeptidase family metallohydrolase [Longimicrobiaceae bacterium]|nr:D-Ala-D-Ala carboxypeptidase family metallohydrolase [Longimicrobiaceae bacterium]
MSDESDSTVAPDPSRLDEISERLARIELLLVGNLADGEESNEPPEPASGESPETVGAAAAAPVPSPAQRFEQFIDGFGFPSFRGSEFTPYWTRVRNGVQNSVPPEELWPNLLPTLVVLQRFRDEIGSPVRLLSTYRSEAYNAAVGGAGESQHTRFRAIDFTVAAGTPAQWAARLRSFRGRMFRNPGTGSQFEFRGGIGVYPASHFVHLDTRGVDRDW